MRAARVMDVAGLLKRPVAWLPPAMSLAALTFVLGHIALHGVAREADEGAAAHIYQLLMVAQAPVVALFAIRWLPSAPRPALKVLALQLAAALAALAPVSHLGL